MPRQVTAATPRLQLASLALADGRPTEGESSGSELTNETVVLSAVVPAIRVRCSDPRVRLTGPIFCTK